MRSEYIAAIILGVCILISAILVVKAKREARKELREAVNKACIEWAKTFDYVKNQHENEVSCLKDSLMCKDDLIEEKDKRIEDLEAQIARNEAIMDLVNVTESLRGEIHGAK